MFNPTQALSEKELWRDKPVAVAAVKDFSRAINDIEGYPTLDLCMEFRRLLNIIMNTKPWLTLAESNQLVLLLGIAIRGIEQMPLPAGDVAVARAIASDLRIRMEVFLEYVAEILKRTGHPSINMTTYMNNQP